MDMKGTMARTFVSCVQAVCRGLTKVLTAKCPVLLIASCYVTAQKSPSLSACQYHCATAQWYCAIVMTQKIGLGSRERVEIRCITFHTRQSKRADSKDLQACGHITAHIALLAMFIV